MIRAVITSAGTESAWEKVRRSSARAPVTYSLPSSIAACCSPLTTSTAARSTTSGHSAAASSSDSGRIRWKERTAGSVEHGSAPAWRSTEVIATASSPTAHEIVESPKSITPSGVRRPSRVVQTRLSPVRSPVRVPPGRYVSSRARAGPSPVGTVTGPARTVPARSPPAAATCSAAASCASISAAVNTGFAILSTPRTRSSGSTSTKLLSC